MPLLGRVMESGSAVQVGPLVRVRAVLQEDLDDLDVTGAGGLYDRRLIINVVWRHVAAGLAKDSHCKKAKVLIPLST